MTLMTEWGKRITLTINNAYIDEDLTDFPIYIQLSASTGLNNTDVTDVFTELSTASGSYPNRKKIAMSEVVGESEIQVPVEIELWDDTTLFGNKKAHLWAKIPYISASTPTMLHLYYNPTHADNTSYVGDIGSAVAQSVWDSSYVAVWHLSQSPTGGAGCIKDSTSNNRHCTPYNMTAGNLVDGKTGKCLQFNSSNQHYLTVAGLTMNTFTMEVTTNATGGTWLAANGATIRWAPGGTQISLLIGYGGDWLVGPTYTCATLPGIWRHIASKVINATSEQSFVDGASIGTSTFGGVPVFTNGGTLYIGQRGDNYACFDGYMEELRLSYIARSNAWIKATYRSNMNTLISYEIRPLYYFSGHTQLAGSNNGPYKIYAYRRDTGALTGVTTSNSGGEFYAETTYSGEHFIVSLDDTGGANYNDKILGKIIPGASF